MNLNRRARPNGCGACCVLQGMPSKRSGSLRRRLFQIRYRIHWTTEYYSHCESQITMLLKGGLKMNSCLQITQVTSLLFLPVYVATKRGIQSDPPVGGHRSDGPDATSSVYASDRRGGWQFIAVAQWLVRPPCKKSRKNDESFLKCPVGSSFRAQLERGHSRWCKPKVRRSMAGGFPDGEGVRASERASATNGTGD